MRIVSWNINGIRSAYKKGLFEWVKAEQPDVCCLQEAKAFPEQVPGDLIQTELEYHREWAVSERPGYSGVVTYSKRPPLRVKAGLGVLEFDREGRVLTTWHDDVVLVNVYVPNGQPDHNRVPFKLRFCDTLLKYMEYLRSECPNVILCGDYNIAHKPIDLKNAKANENTTGFLPIERAWMDRLVEHGYVDIFRTFESGPGHYTWWSYRAASRERNVGWRLDYFFVSAEMQNRVKSAHLHPDVMGSDHCPVSLEL